jgi:hypothetical protein
MELNGLDTRDFDSGYTNDIRRRDDIKRDNELRAFKEKNANSRYIKIGHYGFDWMSRMPDPIIFDKLTRKYYVKNYFNKMKEVSKEEIKKNMKNTNNYNMYYNIYKQEQWMPYTLGLSLIKNC